MRHKVDKQARMNKVVDWAIRRLREKSIKTSEYNTNQKDRRTPPEKNEHPCK